MMPAAVTAMDGLMPPLQRIAVVAPTAPVAPHEKKVAVKDGEPVLAGKSMFAAGETVPPEPDAVVIPVLRFTEARA